VWTAPCWQGFSSRLQLGRCSHVFGLTWWFLRQVLIWIDRDPRRGSRFCRLPLQTSHPVGIDPSHCPAFGTGRAPRERHHSILTALWRHAELTALWRHAEQRRRSLGSPDRSAWQRSPDCGIDQAADFKTAPSGTTPSTTNLHSAISSFELGPLP